MDKSDEPDIDWFDIKSHEERFKRPRIMDLEEDFGNKRRYMRVTSDAETTTTNSTTTPKSTINAHIRNDFAMSPSLRARESSISSFDSLHHDTVGEEMCDLEIDRRRFLSQRKLKSAWDSIYERYGRDMEDEVDELNIFTLEVLVNRGHLKSMRKQSRFGTTAKMEMEKDYYDELNGVCEPDVDEPDSDADVSSYDGHAEMYEEVSERNDHVPMKDLISTPIRVPVSASKKHEKFAHGRGVIGLQEAMQQAFLEPQEDGINERNEELYEWRHNDIRSIDLKRLWEIKSEPLNDFVLAVAQKKDFHKHEVISICSSDLEVEDGRVMEEGHVLVEEDEEDTDVEGQEEVLDEEYEGATEEEYEKGWEEDQHEEDWEEDCRESEEEEEYDYYVKVNKKKDMLPVIEQRTPSSSGCAGAGCSKVFCFKCEAQKSIMKVGGSSGSPGIRIM